jgi:hypothetical protein
VVIVCDGCSSSLDTDIGARLLAKAALSNIKACETVLQRPLTGEFGEQDYGIALRKAFKYDEQDREQDYQNAIREAFRESIFKAQSAVNILTMSSDCLDATLLTLTATENYLYLLIAGDGGFVYKTTNGNITSVLIDYESGAPEYLSYTLDKNRHIGYRDAFDNTKKIETFVDGDHVDTKSNSDMIYDCFFNKKDIEWITIFSDGIATFDGLSWVDITKELSKFKRLGGEVVKRRMKRFIKDLSKQGVTHADDFSAATIVLKDVEDA